MENATLSYGEKEAKVKAAWDTLNEMADDAEWHDIFQDVEFGKPAVLAAILNRHLPYAGQDRITVEEKKFFIDVMMGLDRDMIGQLKWVADFINEVDNF